jgi:hypothetical protein
MKMKMRARIALEQVRAMLYDPDNGDRPPRIEDGPILKALRAAGYDVTEAVHALRALYPRPGLLPRARIERRRARAHRREATYVEDFDDDE